MTSYRNLVQQLQKRNNITFDQSLQSVSIILKAIAHQLSREETMIMRGALAPELRQLVIESRARPAIPAGRHEGQLIVELVSGTLEIRNEEAKRRTLTFISELRAGVGPWEDVRFAELLDRIAAAVDSVLIQAAVA